MEIPTDEKIILILNLNPRVDLSSRTSFSSVARGAAWAARRRRSPLPRARSRPHSHRTRSIGLKGGGPDGRAGAVAEPRGRRKRRTRTEPPLYATATFGSVVRGPPIHPSIPSTPLRTGRVRVRFVHSFVLMRASSLPSSATTAAAAAAANVNVVKTRSVSLPPSLPRAGAAPSFRVAPAFGRGGSVLQMAKRVGLGLGPPP